MEFLKLDAGPSRPSREILENLNGQLLAETTAITKAERCEARIASEGPHAELGG
jgi:hypothetical protein